MSNITDLSKFRSEPEVQIPAAPDFLYEIKLKDGTTVQEHGYFAINSIFAGICQGNEGIIAFAVPTDQFAGVKNLGPYKAVTGTVN